MNLPEHERKTLDEFFIAIEPILPGYKKHASFSYLAIKHGDVFVLSQGRLHLQGVPLPVPPRYFESQNVRAGNFKLIELGNPPKDLIETLLSGKLPTPHDVELNFPVEQNRSYSVYFNPFHTDGIQSQRRQMQLVISGGYRPQLNSQKIDWELKAATTPYDSVQDLCSEYVVGPISQNSHISVEVAAHNIAVIDASSSVKRNKAHLVIVLADGLDRRKASIGFRVFDKNKIIKRRQISGSKLKWRKKNAVQSGVVDVRVPSGAVLQCFANYAGEAHHYFWVTDQSTAPNPRRAVHQAFDDELEILQELLKTHGKGREARDFESAIAWLLWMLGFSVTHLGGTPKTSDALDLIATTPQGHFLVIECTTGLLKAENKLPNLIDRAEKVRKSLANSGNGHLKVLPVIVTNKTREEVKADLEQAEKLGIFVGTSEGFVSLINRTLITPDPDLLYIEAEDAIRRTQNPDPSIISIK